RHQEAADYLVSSTEEGLSSNESLTTILDAERNLWRRLGESVGESEELAGNSGLVKKYLSTISLGALQIAEPSVASLIGENERLAFVNQSMEVFGALNASLGKGISFSLSKAIQRTELRSLESLDPQTL